MQKQKIMQLLSQLKNAAAILSDSVFLINEMIGESDAMDDVATLRRSRFKIVKNEEAKKGVYKFNQKEMEKMPLFYKHLFITGDVVAHWRERSGNLIEIRCQIKGKKITASAKTKEAAAQKFIEKLEERARTLAEHPQSGVTFYEYAQKWLETVKKPNVKATTYEDYLSTFNMHLFPAFGKLKLTDIKQFDVQKHLNALLAVGKSRTAHKQLQILRSIFEYAIADDLIVKSPMILIKLPYHEETHGEALTKDEETKLVESCITSNTRSGKAIVFMLYTGLRRSELATVRLEDGFAIVVSAKQRKGRKEKSRAIPISPRLRRFLPNLEQDVATFKDLYMNRLSRKFKEWLPDHHLHELRHTFITRCQECGISRELVSVWAGHKADNTMTSNVYTHFSAEFQKAEILKFDY